MIVVESEECPRHLRGDALQLVLQVDRFPDRLEVRERVQTNNSLGLESAPRERVDSLRLKPGPLDVRRSSELAWDDPKPRPGSD